MRGTDRIAHPCDDHAANVSADSDTEYICQLSAIPTWNASALAAIQRRFVCDVTPTPAIIRSPGSISSPVSRAPGIRPKKDPAPASTAETEPPHERQRLSHALLNPPATFVGRATECTQLIGCITDPTTQLVTIVGPGGIGKPGLRSRSPSCCASSPPLVAWMPLVVALSLWRKSTIYKASPQLSPTRLGYA